MPGDECPWMYSRSPPCSAVGACQKWLKPISYSTAADWKLAMCPPSSVDSLFAPTTIAIDPIVAKPLRVFRTMATANGREPAPAQAAEAIGPEAEVLAAVDPLALGEAAVKLAEGLLMNPRGVLEATGSYLSGLGAAT